MRAATVDTLALTIFAAGMSLAMPPAVFSGWPATPLSQGQAGLAVALSATCLPGWRRARAGCRQAGVCHWWRWRSAGDLRFTIGRPSLLAAVLLVLAARPACRRFARLQPGRCGKHAGSGARGLGVPVVVSHLLQAVAVAMLLVVLWAVSGLPARDRRLLLIGLAGLPLLLTMLAQWISQDEGALPAAMLDEAHTRLELAQPDRDSRQVAFRSGAGWPALTDHPGGAGRASRPT